MSKAVVLFSGGQDSTTCLFWAMRTFTEVVALSFDYNQRHNIELESAKQIAASVGIRHEIVQMGPIFRGLSPLTNHALDVASYDSAENLPGGLEDTFVPGRNILFLCIAANRAYTLGFDNIVIGVSQEDSGGYPDCREDFITRMQHALCSGMDTFVKIHTPLMHLTKAQSVELAAVLPGCMQALAYSTTCYNGSYPPCGKCHSCLLRERGFAQSGFEDPLLQRVGQGSSAAQVRTTAGAMHAG